jgi:hypothetical protein
MDEYYFLYAGALKVFCDFSFTNYKNYQIIHDKENMKFERLRKKYPIEKVAGKGSDFECSKNIMKWLYDNIWHNGKNPDKENIKRDPILALDYSFGNGYEKGLVCRHQAALFTECCLAVGLTARTIHCLPFSPYDIESHVVSMVYMREMKKWILLDTTNNAYFINNQGIPLSPLEARYYLSIDDININNELQPRNKTEYEIKANDYKKYMARVLFYFEYSAINTYGTDGLVKNQKTYFLIPKGFDVKNRELLYCQSWMSYNKDSKWLRERKLMIKNKNINIVSEKQFLKI